MSFSSTTGTMGPFVLGEDCVGFIGGGSASCGTFEDGPGFFEIELAADTTYNPAPNEVSASGIAVSINGPCTIELDSTYTLSHAGANSWTTQDEIGSYTLSSCSPAEASVIIGNLGPSPSSGIFAADWIIDVS